ncbi:hypothetical protein QTP88_010941 [Uroleucon formosanum]
MLPSKTLAAQSEKSAPGHKSSKERLTIMTCSNATGSHKIKLTVIEKAKKPRSFKGTEMKYLPCDYYHHPKAWMNQVIFSEWFFNVFVPSVQKFQNEKGIPKRAVLLLDNAPSHPSESTLKTPDGKIIVYYLPPNVTSIIQPMDQGVISCLKRRYKMIFLRYLLQEDCFDSMKELLKTWTIKDAIFAVCNAWENVPAITLRLSWPKILDQDYDDEESIEDTVDKDIKACLDLATSIPDFTNVDEDDIVDWLQKDLNEEGFERLSDSDMAVRYGSVTTPSTTEQPDSSSESDNEEHFEKIQTSQAMEAVDVLLNFCKQENFDFHVIGLRKIRSECTDSVQTIRYYGKRIYKINKLTGNENWGTWKFQIRVIMTAADIFDVVTGKSKKPVLTKSSTETEDDTRKRYSVNNSEWKKADNKG